jgi:hypothetical protein
MASPIAESKCAVCGSWPASQRDEMRKLINELEFKKIDLTCDKCVEAFWLNCMSASEKRRKQDDSMSSSSNQEPEQKATEPELSLEEMFARPKQIYVQAKAKVV